MTSCQICDIPLPAPLGRGRPRKYCSKRCQDRAGYLRSPKPPSVAVRVQRECVLCGGPFVTSSAGQRYCSAACISTKRRFYKYGLSPSVYREMLESQGNKCAACRFPFDGEIPRIDHCHETNDVRGLIHNKCNMGLGQADHDPAKLRAWADYLDAA